MQRSDIEEISVKCCRCTNGLTAIDVMLHGNKCVFCVQDTHLSFMDFIRHVRFSYTVYKLSRKLKKKFGEDAPMYFFGALGATGLSNINSVKSRRDRKQFIQEIKGLLLLDK